MNLTRARIALAAPAYRDYAIGNLISLVGTWMNRVAVGWLCWELTQSGFWLGILAFADLFPTVILSPISGTLADRHDRMKLIKIMTFAQCLLATGLTVLTVLGWIEIWSLLAFVMAMGAVTALAQPARLAVLSVLVPSSALTAAVALNSTAFNLARFIGPMIAGYAIAHGGTWVALALNALSYAVYQVLLVRMPSAPPAARAQAKRDQVTAWDGYRYAMREPGIRALVLLLLASALAVRGFTELLPGFADDVFGRGAIGLAWLTAAVGVGAMAAGLVMAARDATRGLTRSIIRFQLVMTVVIGVFAASDNFFVALACMTVAGYSLVMTGIGIQTLLQIAPSPQFRGRVLGIYGTLFRGGVALGAMVMGLFAGPFGLQPPVLVGAVLGIGIWAWARTQRAAIEALEQPISAGDE